MEKSAVQGFTRKSLKAKLDAGHATFHGPDCRCTDEPISTITSIIFGNGCRDCWQSSDGWVTTLIWPCRKHRALRSQSFLWFFGLSLVIGLLPVGLAILVMVLSKR